MRLQPLSNFFPLHTYSEQDVNPRQGAEASDCATLWISPFDARSMFWKTCFELYQVAHTVKVVDARESAPGGALPALLRPETGDLLSEDQMENWWNSHHQPETKEEGTKVEERAWLSLFEQKLRPVWVSVD